MESSPSALLGTRGLYQRYQSLRRRVRQGTCIGRAIRLRSDRDMVA
jgi:hypothetical protein